MKLLFWLIFQWLTVISYILYDKAKTALHSTLTSQMQEHIYLEK